MLQSNADADMRNLLHHFDKLRASHFTSSSAMLITHAPRNLIVTLIRVYRQTLSPDHGPLRHLFPYGYCRHSPTCSQYAEEVILRRGAIVGTLMAAGRVLTCNPFVKPSEKRLLEVAERL